jgi:hypothetical protein
MNDTAPFVPAPEIIDVITQELSPQSTHDLIVSTEETQRRLSFCINCEHLGHNESNVPICLECGCNMSMLTTMSFKSCPINKWTC